MTVGCEKVLEQFDFEFRARGEVGVAALAGKGNVFASVPKNTRFAQTGARRDDGHIACGGRVARVKNGEVGWVQLTDAVSIGNEVVDEESSAEAEAGALGIGINLPRQIDQFGAIAADRPGQTETGIVHGLPFVGQKLGHKLLEAGCGPAGKFGRPLQQERRGGIAPAGAEDTQPCFCPPDISAQNDRPGPRGERPHGMRFVGLGVGWSAQSGHGSGSSGRIFPMAPVALEKFVGRSRAPSAGFVVGEIARRQSTPDVEDGIHDAP